MKRYILLIATLLIASAGWGQTSRGTLPDPNEENEDLYSGIYTLTKNYTPGKEKRWRVNSGRDVIIDLNGYTIDGVNINRAIFNIAHGTLTITDSKGGGVIKNSTKSCIYVQPASDKTSTFNFQGGTIQDCQPSDGNGGAMDIQPRGIVNMSGGVIIGCRGTNGAAVYVTGGTFNMTGGEIKDNKVNDYKNWTPPTGTEDLPTSTNTNSSRGGGIYVEKGTCTMSGGTISGNVAHSGGGVFVTSGATFSFTGGIITGNYAVSKLGAGTGNGGGIYIEGGNSNCTINGGIVSNNRATRYGGGININGSTMTIPNCTISGNLSSSGGGISMETSGSTLNLQGCTLDGNISNVSSSDPNGANAGGGGGIFLVDGTLNISGNNSFQSNVSNVLGGGIYLKKGTLTILDGTSTFTNNQSKSGGAIYHASGNITVNEGATLNLGGVSIDDGNKSTTHGGGIYCAGTITANGTSNIMYNSAGTHGGGIYCTGSFISNGNSTIQNNSAVSDGGGVYMSGDAITLQGNTTNITANSSGNYGGALYVNRGTITIKGVSSINNNYAFSGGAIYLNNGSMITQGSTTVDSNYSTENGGAIYVLNGNVQMENPTITGNGKNGSTVSTKQGGAIFISGVGAAFTATGTSNISSNAAISNGGAIYVLGGNVTLETNTISSNTALTGGAVFLTGGLLKTTVSANITNNYATQNGGAFYLVNGQVEMVNPTITGNGKNPDGETVTANGGAIFVLLDDSTQGEVSGFKATGTSVISSNASSVSGGAMCVKNGDVQLESATISSNVSKAGGALYLVGGSVTLSGAAEIKDNTASTNGGAAFVNKGSITTATGTSTTKLSGNKATNGEGGAFYIAGEQGKKGTLNLQGVTSFIGNEATNSNGGAASLHYGDIVITGSNTTLTSNKAKNGGAFYVNNGDITTTAGTMSGNEASADGGVFYVNKGHIYLGTDADNENHYGITLQNNTANNGGAIALYNGEFALSNQCLIKNNTASANGGGLYVKNEATSGTPTSISCKGGSFEGNKAKLGGGIYAYGNIALAFAANVRDNIANNGGGLYLDGGVDMVFGDGLIVANTASENQSATFSMRTRSTNSTNGIGGGIYLANGELSFECVDNSEIENFGIYNNVASYQAADIYSAGNGVATIKIPYVEGMNLTGFDVPGDKLYWVRDYNLITLDGVDYGRYESALLNLDTDIEKMILHFTEGEIAAGYKPITNEVCLDLGYDLVFVDLKSDGLTLVNKQTGMTNTFDVEVKIYYVRNGEDSDQSNDELRLYRTVMFTGDITRKVGLPSGGWIFQVNKLPYGYNNTIEDYNGTKIDVSDKEYQGTTYEALSSSILIERTAIKESTDKSINFVFELMKSDQVPNIQYNKKVINKMKPLTTI